MKLREMPNTVVNVKTQAEYDELMQIYEDAGWKWCDCEISTEGNYWNGYDTSTCIKAQCYFNFCSIGYYKSRGFKIITLQEFKKEQEMDYPKIFKDKRDNTFVKIWKIEGNDEYFARSYYKSTYEKVKDNDVVIDTLNKYELEAIHEEYTPTETVEINGKKYDAKEVEERLSELKEIDD